MKKRIIIIVSLFLVMLFTLGIVSCGSKGGAENDSASKDSYIGEMAGPAENIGKTEIGSTSVPSDGTKIIKTATVNAETQKYAESTDELKALISSLGGHIATSNANENASYRTDGKTEKYANYTVKIPADKFDEFLSKLSELFNVTNLSTATEDVSESYFTLQARICTLEAKREGLVSMLKNVDVNTDFTTWQKINAELTEIDTQLTVYNEQLKSLENRVAYSTVTLSVREVAEYTEIEEKGYGAKVSEAFKDGFTSAGEFFKELLLIIIRILPFLLLWIACITIVVVCVVVRRKKAKKKNNNESK